MEPNEQLKNPQSREPNSLLRTDLTKQDFKLRFGDDVKAIVKEYLQSQGFSDRKVADTPTDDYMVTPRKYVNAYGPSVRRPTASVAHLAQQYFDTTIGRPIYFNPNSSVWTDGAGSIS